MDYLLDGLRIYGTVNYQDNYNRIVKYKPSIPTYSVQRNHETTKRQASFRKSAALP